jgi:hypothetical protein
MIGTGTEQGQRSFWCVNLPCMQLVVIDERPLSIDVSKPGGKWNVECQAPAARQDVN